MSTLYAGRILRGKNGFRYKAIEQVSKKSPNVWHAQTYDQPPKDVILKTVRSGRSDLFWNEVHALALVQDHDSFRRLVDDIPGQKIMVLEHLVGNLQDVLLKRPNRMLERREVKIVAKVLLEGLDHMHSKNLAHTDVKPDNILVNHDKGVTWISKPKVCDLGDSVHVEPTTNHEIGAPIYRAPEVNLGLRWTQAVDIWSFGVTVMELLTGVHFLAPPGVPEDHEQFIPRVIIRQFGFFGPYPEKYADIVAPIITEVNELKRAVGGPVAEQLYRNTLAQRMKKEDLDFLLSFMKIDPRDRPSAEELLQDPWVKSV